MDSKIAKPQHECELQTKFWYDRHANMGVYTLLADKEKKNTFSIRKHIYNIET